MPPVRKIDTLPSHLRRELDERAAAAGFGDVRGLSAWLKEEGWEISKSAVGEHVRTLRAEYDETMREVRAMAELARLLVDADPDEQASINDLAGRLMTDQLVRAAKELRSAQELPIDERITLLGKLARPITDAQRAAVYARRWNKDQRREAEEAARAAARDAGLDEDTAQRIASAVQIYLPENNRRGGAG